MEISHRKQDRKNLIRISMSGLLSKITKRRVVDLVADIRYNLYLDKTELSFTEFWLRIYDLSDKELVKMLGDLIEPVEEEDTYATRTYSIAVTEIAVEEMLLGNQ